jgi:hypothetical protein
MANNFDAYFNTPSKQKRGEERVEKILDSVEQTLDANPMAKLDVRSIANAANISTGALYHHFPSIANLLTSLFIRKVKSTNRKTIDLINQLGSSVQLDELANVLVDHTFLVWRKGNPNIKKIAIKFFYRNAKEPELLYTFIDPLIPHFKAFIARNTTNTIRNIADEDWSLILRTIQTAVASPFIEGQEGAGSDSHRRLAKDAFCRLLKK